MQRSLLIFQNSLRSKESVKNYKWYFDAFLKSSKLDYDSVVVIEPSKLQILVEDYIMELKQRVSPNSMTAFFYPIKAFFEANDIELKYKKILRLFPERVKKNSREAWTTDDIQKMLEATTELKAKSLIHFLASSGCRIGALSDLKLRHVTQIGDGCKCILLYENTKDEHNSFLTPEASKTLDDYLEKRKGDCEQLTQESPLYRSDYILGSLKAVPSSKDALKQMINRVVKRAGFRGISNKTGKRYLVPLNNGFRKRFVTILKLNPKIPQAITERLVGHKMYADNSGNKFTLDDSYMRATKSQLFDCFQLAIPDLTISKEARQGAEIEKLAKERDLEKDQKLKYDSFFKKATLELKQKSEAMTEMKQNIDKTLELENRNRKDLDRILERKQELDDFVKVIAEHIKTGKRSDDHRFDKQLDAIKDLITDDTNTDQTK